MISAEDLKGATEVLSRLADSLNKPDRDGYARVLFEKKYFGAIQKLMKGTEWEGRYCWETKGDGWRVTLAVDTKPLPVMVRCPHCEGKGIVSKEKKYADNHHR